MLGVIFLIVLNLGLRFFRLLLFSLVVVSRKWIFVVFEMFGSVMLFEGVVLKIVV